ncbi:MAG: radical SAM protein [Thermodesulfovibrionales bacterium]|nr:radical SAM protein [Thermodesulfovibrionales bacterium]
MQYIQLFLTFQCNQSCDFCFNRGIDSADSMTLEDFRKIVSILKMNGIRELDILGGEPLMHRDIISVLEIASDNFDSIFISTNGSDIEFIKRLKQLFPRINIGISLNAEPEAALKEFIFDSRPIIKSLAKRNYIIPPWAKNFMKNRIPYYIIFRDVLYRNELCESMPFYDFLNKVENLRHMYPELRPVYCSAFISEDHSAWRCPAGSTKLSIMPDGSVFPCYLFFRFPEFRLGNIFESELNVIILKPLLHLLRQRANNCNIPTCDIRGRCKGGCPAVSYAICGDLNSPDPRCILNVRDH